MPCGIQVVIDSKGGHTKYRNVLTMTLLDVILFQIVLYYAFGEISLYNLVRRSNKITVLSILFLKLCLVLNDCSYKLIFYSIGGGGGGGGGSVIKKIAVF